MRNLMYVILYILTSAIIFSIMPSRSPYPTKVEVNTRIAPRTRVVIPHAKLHIVSFKLSAYANKINHCDQYVWCLVPVGPK